MAYFHTTVLDNQIKALPTVSTASGAIATFDTDMTENLVEVKCQIVAQQASGTPSPDNPLPIQTYDSLTLYHNDINMWDEQWEVYGSGATARIGSKNPIPCVGGRTYYLTSTPAYGWKFYDADDNLLLTYYNKTCVAPNNAVYMMFQLDDTYGTVYNHDVSLNYPATDTEYHAFNGAYIPFGQTVANGVLDIGSGKLRVTHELGDLGSVIWSPDPNRTGRFYGGLSGRKPASWLLLCDSLQVNNVGTNSLQDNQISGRSDYGSTAIFARIDSQDGKTGAEFKTYVTGMKVLFELNTPIEIQLDSTQITALLNENNIWCDTGDTEVKFILTVGKKIS